MRKCKTGATRDDIEGKFEYFKFFSLPAFHAYASYMHEKRIQPDGRLRDADNWQKGMPREWYASSMVRHLLDVQYHHQNFETLSKEDLKTALCALLFNVQAYLHEVMIDRDIEE